MPKVAAMLSNRSNRNMVESAPDSLGPSDFKYLGIRHSFCDQPIMFRPNERCQNISFSYSDLILIQIVKHVGTPHSLCPEKWLPTASEGCRSGKLFSIIWLRFPSVFCFPAQGNVVLYVVWCSGHVMNLSTSSSCTICICSSLCFCKCYCVFVFVVLACCVV